MATPGQSSGTYLFDPANAQLVMEAFDRCDLPFPANDRHKLISARMSLNLELQSWSNRGVALWEIISGTINLAAPVGNVGQATYTLPATLIMLTEMYFTTVNGNGTGLNYDRWMDPITRTQYAQLPNKLQAGQPSQYWYQRLLAPQVSIYQTAFAGAPNYLLSWFGLQQIQDAGIASGETPNIPYRAFDALAAGLARRFAEKWAPARLAEKTALAAEAWDAFTANDDEPGPLLLQPNVAGYAKMM